jgi:YihY family inner membrane protein
MNPAERLARRVDAAQQRFLPTSFLVGVIKKYGDDNAGVLVTNLAYAAFISVFPLLLILVTVLVNVAADDPSLRAHIISGATSQFPYLGRQLTDNIHALRRSTVAGLVVGLLLLVWGVTRLAQAGMFTMAQIWNLPGPDRLGYFPRLARSVVFLLVLALGVAVSTLLAGLVTFGHHALAFRALAQLLAGLANIALYYLGFRVLTPRTVRRRQLLPGVLAGGVCWSVLQAVGAYLVHHYLRADSVYGTVFGTVLGLLAWIYVGAESTVYAAEINVVLAHRLWPRALVQPPLTAADRASMTLQALQNQRRPEQLVEVSYPDPEADPAASMAADAAPSDPVPPRPTPGTPARAGPRPSSVPKLPQQRRPAG